MGDQPPKWSADLLGSVADADTPQARLRALAPMLRDAQAHLDAVLEERDRACERLRAEGVAMADIGRMAGVDDAYLSRRLLKRGARRRTGRSVGPVRWRPGRH